MFCEWQENAGRAPTRGAAGWGSGRGPFKAQAVISAAFAAPPSPAASPVRMRAAAAHHWARDAPAVAVTPGLRRRLQGCGAYRPPRSQSPAAARRPHTLPPPWAPEVSCLAGLAREPQGGTATPKRGGLLVSERPARGTPGFGRRRPGGEGTKEAGAAAEGVGIRLPTRASPPPREVARGCARSLSTPTWRGQRLECNRTCPRGGPGRGRRMDRRFARGIVCSWVGVLAPGTAE